MNYFDTFLWAIAGFFISFWLIWLYIIILFWIKRKITLLRISFRLMSSKHKEIRKIGWLAFKTFLWEY